MDQNKQIKVCVFVQVIFMLYFFSYVKQKPAVSKKMQNNQNPNLCISIFLSFPILSNPILPYIGVPKNVVVPKEKNVQKPFFHF